MRKHSKLRVLWREHHKTALNLGLLFTSLGIGLAALLVIWIATVKIPDFSSFEERKIARSTKIYDRTGETVLYDINQDIRRTVVPFSAIGENIRLATIAIEDADFYNHPGIRVTSIIRAVLANLTPGGYTQGGSTITQQVVKMTLLSPEKTITRKTKEWILSVKLDAAMEKDDILAIYLNEAPYGGSMYGIKEASRAFFAKEPTDLSLAQAAYLAAIPQAPTYYSPYGQHRDDLDIRKDLVLSRMKEVGYITEAQYAEAKAEVIEFQPQTPNSIRAPHFVFFVKDYLEQQYGKDAVESGGLKVITTLDYKLQEKAEKVVSDFATSNQENFNASNASLVAIDPKTGDILTMVGSRNYFDTEIDGNYNIATAKRQPGSSFKPFVYVTAFKKGYTPNTVLFDVPTEFQTTCDAYGQARPGYSQDECYMPENYDGLYRGPMSLRDALAQSINVPAVKTLYLVGIKEAIKTARDLGIRTLADQDRYGLTLVLGGGEVTLLEMTSAYSVLANTGVRNPYQSIIRVEDAEGNILEEHKNQPITVLAKNDALMISDILSDNVARTPLYGTTSPLYFGGRDVASKTGTTNDYRDVWTVGYTPSIAIGAWAGNNDNSPMVKKTSGTIIAPLWHAFMAEALKTLPDEQFETPVIPNDPKTLKPVIRGLWQGGSNFFIDSVSGGLATEYTPTETLQEKVITDVHSILYWVDKKDPLGPAPERPQDDPQFSNWETAVQNWWRNHSFQYPFVSASDRPTMEDTIHTAGTVPSITIISPTGGRVYGANERMTVSLSSTGRFPLSKVDLFINGAYISTAKNQPFTFSFIPSEIDSIQEDNELKIVAYDSAFNTTEKVQRFTINNSSN